MGKNLKKNPTVFISHPGKQHSHQTAFALQEGGLLGRFLTPIWYKPKSFPWSFFNQVPILKNRINGKISEKRWFSPLAEEKIHTYPLNRMLPYLFRTIIRRRENLNRKTLFLNKEFDMWVARQLGRGNFNLFVGYETASRKSFEKCREVGVTCVLDHASIHWIHQKEIIREEREFSGESFEEMTPKLLQEVQEIKEKELELVDYVISPSQFSKNSLIKGGIEKNKIFKISYGVDLSVFSKKKTYVKSDEFTVLFVGSLSILKGIRYLLEAFSQLKLPKARLLLIGNNFGAEKILRKYEGIFTHIPFLDQYNLSKYYQMADLLVFPSLMDSFGLVVLEAMACGTPVIVSENTGAKDLVENGKNGFITPVREVDELKEKINYFYENWEAVEFFGGNARKKAEMYSWEIYRKKLKDHVAKILNLPEERLEFES